MLRQHPPAPEIPAAQCQLGRLPRPPDRHERHQRRLALVMALAGADHHRLIRLYLGEQIQIRQR
jgi:hypothetical protein